VDAPAAFIDFVEIYADGTGSCPYQPLTYDSDADGRPDVFEGLMAGDAMCWQLVPTMNVSVMPDDQPQIFQATIEWVGHGNAVQGTRAIYFIVPPSVGWYP
jgi:hypothetical protein